MLRVDKLNAGYGDIQILWDLHVEVETNAITALIGANGVGKTTFLRTISGVLKPYSGTIEYDGEDITYMPQPERVKHGIMMVPEGRQLYRGLTVEDNLTMGAYSRKIKRTELRNDIDWVYSLLPQLKERRSSLAGTLSGGEAQMCAIGRGLMANPRFLMLDELSLGLAPVIVDDLVRILKEINRENNITILLVDQDVQTALSIASRGYVFSNGQVEMTDDADTLLKDPQIQKAYLGI
jgi:branched-chain amino acid transport system ATP-binding protein